MTRPLYTMQKRLQQSELVQGIDDEEFASRGVLCPVDWCEAHAHRHARCGDADGPFEGIHRGRLNGERVVAATTARKVKRTATEGLPLSAGFSMLFDDMANRGELPGVVGPRLKNQRRARKKMGMP